MLLFLKAGLWLPQKNKPKPEDILPWASQREGGGVPKALQDVLCRHGEVVEQQDQAAARDRLVGAVTSAEGRGGGRSSQSHSAAGSRL